MKENIKRCKRCGDFIILLHPRTLYCDFCKTKKHYRYSTALWKRLRKIVLERDNFVCNYCGKEGTLVDHILPISKGGADIQENLAASCRKCNSKKNNHIK